MTVRVRLISLLWRNLYAIVNPQQTRRSLQSTLQRLDLRDGRLEDTCISVIDDFAVDQVQTVEHEAALGIVNRGILSGIVVSSEFSHKIRGVLCGVDGQGFRDGKQRLGEFSDGQLFSRPLNVS